MLFFKMLFLLFFDMFLIFLSSRSLLSITTARRTVGHGAEGESGREANGEGESGFAAAREAGGEGESGRGAGGWVCDGGVGGCAFCS